MFKKVLYFLSGSSKASFDISVSLFRTIPVLALLVYGALSANAEVILVKDQVAFKAATKSAQPGDVIKLANGTWNDFEILFRGNGLPDAPITLTAETKGKVFLSGQSNLRIAGEYLVVSGIVFKNGYTPTKDVIAFRQNKENLAYHSRVTEVVIDNYNQPERYEVDFWVTMYGKNNRFDHNHLVGKRNKGVTMAVRLDSDSSRENHHRIDHNYFGPRPILGSNGGETLRIGTSHNSLSDSYTLVENNYFDRCNGELEIISNKSGKNVFRNNTFFESRGTLTLRHGDDNLVEGNVFFGNGKDHTGGIRVINAEQKIRNNYMEGLKGTRFGGALVVMNGVPNSPINRYHQVRNAQIENNTIVESDNIQLAAGSDEERSATPLDSLFRNNLIVNSDGRDVFTVYDDVSGIEFRSNVLGYSKPPSFADGFIQNEVVLERSENGLMYPQRGVEAGIPRGLVVTSKEMTGVSWFPKTEPLVPFQSGVTHSVASGEGQLFAAVQAANPGDIIALQSGDYVATKFMNIDKTLTFKADGIVNLAFERSSLFEIRDGGALQVIGLNITGADAPDNAGNSVIRTSLSSMLENYRLEILDSHIIDADINHSFNFLTAAKGTFADYILIQNSTFKDVSGAVLKLDAEIDDYGIYNAEYVTIENTGFKNIGGDIVDYYRGGTDESTFGPHFKISASTVSGVGKDKRNRSKSSIFLQGVQVTNIQENDFQTSNPIRINHTVGEPQTDIVGNTFSYSKLPEVYELNSGGLPTARLINNNEVMK